MKKVRVGSRDSKLAVIQAQRVIDAIKRYDPSIGVELITMKTTGDKILDRTLDKIGGKGLFVKELDQALNDCKVDITVHSYKDMPMEDNGALPVIALSEREDPRDVLILPEGHWPEEMDKIFEAGTAHAPIGSSSLRRKLQLEALYPACTTAPVRGNVQTRLAKLQKGEFSALILAAAGIKRLGLEGRISRFFTADEIIPAASQGIIAVQGRAGENFDYLKGFDSEPSWWISLAERTFVRALGAGCSSPVGAYAQLDGDELSLRGIYYDEAGHEIFRGDIQGDKRDAVALGRRLAEQASEKLG